MDLQYAERMAAAADPNAVRGLRTQNGDPAVGKAVAEQFGTLLMQRVMQNADGSALKMADGVGSGVVNSMFAGTMAQTAMAGDKLGLADLLFRSMAAKQHSGAGAAAAAAPGGGGAAPGSPSAATSAPTSAGAAGAPAHGFSLSAYWQDHGLRPLGSGSAHAAPTAAKAAAPLSPGFAIGARNAPAATAVAAAAPQSSPPAGATAAPASGAANGSANGDTNGFAQRLQPLLEKAAQRLGVSPKLLLAQAALETGWGRSVVGNNVFGVKAGTGWHGAQVKAQTHEVEKGQTVAETAAFRSYGSLADAVQDFVSLVAGSGRYRGALDTGDNARSYAEALISGGYATDTDYPAKLAAVAASPAVATAFAGPVQLLPAGFATGGASST